jgi:hypothetical protein
MSQTIEQILTKFGVVTVMEAKFFPADTVLTWEDGVVQNQELFELDTLSISNFTQEGPVKMSKGGLNAEVVFRYGKTARLEMEDVVGRIEALKHLMGVRAINTEATIDKTVTEKFFAIEYQTEFVLANAIKAGQDIFDDVIVKVNGVVATTGFTINEDNRRIIDATATFANGDLVEITYLFTGANTPGYLVTDRFSGYYQIVGRTFVVNEGTGAREYVNFIVNKFLPDSLFNLSMEAEGDLAVFNLAGEIFTNDCGIFYEITKGGQGSCGTIAPL